MREIKFRGFAVAEMVNSQWLTGFGVYPIEFSKEYAERTGRKKEMYLYTEDGTYQVQEKSIGQYTGLKDKNGVEIYEGDCFKGKSGIKIVKYKDGAFVTEYKFNIRGFKEVNISPLIVTSRESVVIGNIYENPELLEVQNG